MLDSLSNGKLDKADLSDFLMSGVLQLAFVDGRGGKWAENAAVGQRGLSPPTGQPGKDHCSVSHVLC